jgi:hypothetical protein
VIRAPNHPRERGAADSYRPPIGLEREQKLKQIINDSLQVCVITISVLVLVQ